MYLKEKLVRNLKIRNVVIAVFCVLSLIVNGFYIVSEFVYYRHDPDTALHAVDMKSAIIWTIFSAAVFLFMLISRKMIGDAVFYSAYFEGALEGEVGVGELAEVTGKASSAVARRLQFLMKIYMKDITLDKRSKEVFVVMKTKKIRCQCLNCGAPIEKSVYYNGSCSYCGGSDLLAGIISGQRYYSISQTVHEGIKKPEYYTAKHLDRRTSLFFVLLVLGIILLGIFVPYDIDLIQKYFDKDYLRELLLTNKSPYSSYQLIKADILDDIVFASSMIAVLIPVLINRLRRIDMLKTARICAGHFARVSKPFIKVSDIRDLGSGHRNDLSRIRSAIRIGYLKKCSIEMHDHDLMIALAKKIVKDKCPGCGAPITGACDENYRCSYCGEMIMHVIVKK